MLFRPEVSQHRQSYQTGQVLLLSGLPAWLILLVTLGFMVFMAALLVYGSYTRRVNVSGEIITWPQTINLFAPQQGVISRLMVTSGQYVKSGTPLYQLDVSRVSPTGNLSVATRQVLLKQRQRTGEVITQLKNNRQATLSGLQQQIDQLLLARKTSQTMADSAAQGLAAMQASMEDYNRYRRRGLITVDQQNNQRYLFYQQQSVSHSLNAQLIQQDMQLSALRSELLTRAADFDSQVTQYGIRRDDIDRQLAEADAGSIRLITAPSDGRISSLSVTEGQMVSAGDSLAQLVPEGEPDLFLVIWLPGDSVPYVRPGEQINIRYAAWPAEKYGQFPGRVVSVSSAPAPAGELAGYASAPHAADGRSSGAWFKALVAVRRDSMRWQGQTLALTSGLQAQATLFLEKRPLYQWMLYPYYSLKKSVTGPLNER
ncbi:HlyD family secretion protein [Enterobacter asburiae]